jgi:hypothetical protein
MISGLLVITACLFSVRVVSWDIALYGILIIWVSLIPLIRPSNDDAIPFFPAIGIFYAVFFGLPVFLIPFAWADADSITLYNRAAVGIIDSDGLAIALGGISSMVLAYYSTAFVWRRVPSLRFAASVENSASVKILLWGLALAHLAYLYLPTIQSLPSIGQLLGPAGYVAIAGFYLLWQRKRISAMEKIVLASMAVLEIYARLRALMLTEIILLAIFVIFLLWRERRFRLIGWLAAAGVMVFPLIYSSTTAFRQTADPGAARLATVLPGVAKVIRQGGPENAINTWLGGRLEPIIKRTGAIWTFLYVDRLSPDPVPYWHGETYLPLVTSWIPRALYPDKPQERAGADFGFRYRIIPATDISNTSVNLPWMVELLANFGRGGVIGGMFAIGLLLGGLNRIFNIRAAGDVAFAVSLTLIFPLVYPESNFSLMLGSLLPLTAALAFYFIGGVWILESIRRAAGASAG